MTSAGLGKLVSGRVLKVHTLVTSSTLTTQEVITPCPLPDSVNMSQRALSLTLRPLLKAFHEVVIASVQSLLARDRVNDARGEAGFMPNLLFAEYFTVITVI